MKTTKSFLFQVSMLLSLLFVCGYAEARTVIVEVSNVRGEQGKVLVMAQGGKDTEPVYGMASPEKGKAVIRLENVNWEKFTISVFHDENENKQMDMTEEKRPMEGYAMKRCEANQDEITVRLKLYYPENE